MTLPSGQISLSQVNTELGYSSTAQINMGATAVRTLAGVPSGAIAMSNLQGKSAADTISFYSAYYPMHGPAYFEATAYFRVNGASPSSGSAGKHYGSTNGAFSGGYALAEEDYGYWIDHPSNASNYEIYASLSSGDSLYTGTLNSWVSTSGNPTWSIRATFAIKSTTLAFQIRKTGTGTVLDSWNVYLYADATQP